MSKPTNTFTFTREWSGHCRGTDIITVTAENAKIAKAKINDLFDPDIHSETVRDDRAAGEWELE